MIRSAAIAVGMLLTLLAVGATPAHACSCEMPGPACERFWKTAAVFDAKVVGIERTSRDDTSSSPTIQIGERLVKLDVRQSWKGVEAGPVEVVTNVGVGSCGFDFKIGSRYLVFADGPTKNGRLHVSICNLTREFDGTGDAADLLASLAEPEKGGRVFGDISLQQTSFKSDGPAWTRTPMDLVARLAGEGRTRTMTASRGRYEFKDLAPGHYEIGITLPEGYSTWRTTQEIDIPNPRACAQTDFLINPAGRIVGQVVDTTQRGIPRVQVEVTREDATGHPIYGLASVSAPSDGNGYFEVRNLPPGRYIAGVNLRDRPNQLNPYPRIVYPGLGLPPHVIRAVAGPGGRSRALGAATRVRAGDRIDRVERRNARSWCVRGDVGRRG